MRLMEYGTVAEDLHSYIEQPPYRHIFSKPARKKTVFDSLQQVEFIQPLLDIYGYFKTHDPFTSRHILTVFALSRLLAQDLFDEMYASLADRSTRRMLKHLSRIDVLVIDEMGYLNLKPEQTNIFFKLMEERYRRYPTIITTNLDYPEWQNFLGNKALVDALLSRLRHQCHTVRIDGPSLRDPPG